MSKTIWLPTQRERMIELLLPAHDPQRQENALNPEPSVREARSEIPVLACFNSELADDRASLRASQDNPPEGARRDRLALDHILLDDRLQSRSLRPGVVKDYLEVLRRGEELPPLRVVHDVNDDYYLVDGHHRVAATRQLIGIEDIAVKIIDGNFDDALWLAWGANRSHGLRRDRMDKRRAIQAAIQHPRWSRESDRAIARQIGCDHKTVATMRRECAGGEFPTKDIRHGAHSQSGPSKRQILGACQLLSKVQPDQLQQFTPADRAIVTVGYESTHRLLFGFSTLGSGKETDRSEK